MVFSLRLVDIDSYLAPPLQLAIHPTRDPDELHLSRESTTTFLDVPSSRIHPHLPLKRVPVLRLFGINSAGQKACVHLHHVWLASSGYPMI